MSCVYPVTGDRSTRGSKPEEVVNARDHPCTVWPLLTWPSFAGHICAPIIQGTVSSLPTPSCSLFDFSPDATANIFSKISLPFCSSVASPSMMSPQLTSMSSRMRAYILELVASLMDGAGFEPKQEPRPVVKATRFAPLAIWPVAPTGQQL